MNTTPAQDNASTVTATSWGERLLPYLFAAIETCWVDGLVVGIASINFLPGTFLVPLWSPFVFIAGVYWLMIHRRQQDSASSLNTILVFAFLILGVLLTLWSSMYAASFPFFDPTWLASLLNDLLLLNGNAFHCIFVLLILAYFGWRGVRLTRNDLEPGSVSRTLKIGLGIFLAVILLRALSGSQRNELILLLLVPLFLAFILIAHSLAQALLLRRSHADGLQGSTQAQENALLSIIVTIGVVLLLMALLIGALASPTFFTQAQHFLAPVAVVYNWIARGIAYVATILLTPLFWLFQLLNLHSAVPKVKQLKLPPNINKPVNAKPPLSDPLVNALAHVVEIALPVLALILVLIAVRVVLRRLRIRKIRRQEDLHESLWSWSLFWTQLRAFFVHLLRRFLPQRQRREQQTLVEEMSGEPAARSIREIYRALLRWAASQGLARKRAETPYEFRARLYKRLPIAEPELSIVTEAYTATRYGRATPSESDVARVRDAWSRIQQSQVQQK